MLGPVNSLAKSIPYNNVVYGAVGGSILVINIKMGKCMSRQQVFSNHIIDSLVVGNDSSGVAFGDNSVALLCFPNEWEVSVTKLFGNLDDRVLDAGIVDVGGSSVLIIGFAHNFLDVVDLTHGSVLSRVHAPTSSCMLFSMSLACHRTAVVAGEDESCVVVPVASGTAMGCVELWECHLNNGDGNCATSTVTAVATDTSNKEAFLKGHEGVIFRMRWSTDRRQLASVSDDRSVRLWDVCSGVALWAGWGHSCRVWDVCFLKSGLSEPSALGPDEPLLVTCSEDGSVRTWSDAGRCLASLYGHGKNVWRVAAVNYSHSTTLTKPYIVSGGNDGKICIWDVERASLSNRLVVEAGGASNSSGASLTPLSDPVGDVFPVPMWSGPVDACSFGATDTNKRRLNGCSNVFVAPEVRHKEAPNCSDHTSVTFVSLTDGGLWCLDAHATTAGRWTAVCHCAQTVVGAGCHFECLDGAIGVALVLAHPDGGATVVRFHYTVAAAGCGDSGRVMITSLTRMRWKAHSIKTVCAWALGACQLKGGSGALSCDIVATASLKGKCSVWLCAAVDESESPAEISCVTGGGHIATVIALVHRQQVGDRELFVFAFGDCRGSITFVAFDRDTESVSSARQIGFFSRVHNTDPVIAITAVGGTGGQRAGCVSLGQDGQIVVYSISLTVTASGEHVQILSRAPSVPIAFPDQVFACPAAAGGGPSTLYIGGYTGDEYLVCEFSKENRLYQLLRVPAGGWKRPHCCSVSQRFLSGAGDFIAAELPWVSFVHCIPHKAGTDIVLTTNYALSGDRGGSLPPCIRNIAPSFGKVGYCCTAIELTDGAASRYFVVGGEDGVLKAYCQSGEGESDCGGLRIAQEMVMRGFVPARAVTACGAESSGHRGVLVACGGKLTYSIWTYDIGTESGPPADCVFRLRVNGATTWGNATQDHRLLTVSCASGTAAVGATTEKGGDIFAVVLGDSRGVATLLTYTDAGCAPLDEFECSNFPLLVSAVVALPGATLGSLVFAGLFGDSNGTVFCYLFEVCLGTRSLLSRVLLATYEAHDMGVNSLTSCSAGVGATGGDVVVVVASGGDDQALCVATLGLKPASESASVSRSPYRARGLSVVRRSGASGSALKGVEFSAGIRVNSAGTMDVPLVAVGYDRRLFLWNVQFDRPAITTTETTTHLSVPYGQVVNLQGGSADLQLPVRISWCSGAPVHVSDIGGCCVSRSRKSGENALVGVVGEGFQLFSCQRDVSVSGDDKVV